MTKEEVIEILERFVLGAKPCSQREIVDACASAYGMLKEQPPLPSNLDEAAKQSAESWRKNPDGSESRELFFQPHIRGFKAGAEWQKEHDHDFCLTCEKNRDVVFHKGMQYAIEQMENDAIELPVKIDAGGYPYIQITGIEFFDYEKDKPTAKEGDVVRILILNGND